eukprot:CAMPEP_0119066142 /NCGR_PEP_ID=MMETSP1178-20130426/8781_1 /TAXON_ID=33656 /ORGANISM="unid sp, Strain CCMP2000" /LENGTH=103 /DNA_ID=CAMNT_0007047717 /DNA_START=121 /DNA_END=429 /DNA_ORIENTATION=+
MAKAATTSRGKPCNPPAASPHPLLPATARTALVPAAASPLPLRIAKPTASGTAYNEANCNALTRERTCSPKGPKKTRYSRPADVRFACTRQFGSSASTSNEAG